MEEEDERKWDEWEAAKKDKEEDREVHKQLGSPSLSDIRRTHRGGGKRKNKSNRKKKTKKRTKAKNKKKRKTKNNRKKNI